MNDPPWFYVVDCHGLHEIANTKSDNLKSLYLDQLEKGVIAVPVCVWDEFQDAYDDEASMLTPHIKVKIRMTNKYRWEAARIADKLNSGFSRGAYDKQTDLYTASIASIENLHVLTTTSQLHSYAKMNCEASDLITWAGKLETMVAINNSVGSHS